MFLAFVLLVAIGMAVAAVVVFFLLGRTGRGGARATLLRLCRGDEAKANRLLAYELERAPGISEVEACHRAVLRVKQDSR